MRLGAIALALLALWLAKHVVRRLRYKPLEQGKLALITGGGSGVGLALAMRFAAAGCKVVLIGRNEEALQAAALKCRNAGAAQCDYIVADLSKQDSAEAVKRQVENLHGGDSLKYLVLNAGAGAIAPFSAEARFQTICNDMMNINFHANVRLLQQFLPQLESSNTASSPSRIVVISSLAGILPSILRSAYTASKHAIQGFMNALRGETEVPITLCCPGYVDTDFHSRVLTSDGKPLPGHQRRGISPEKCAKTCLEGALHSDAEVIMTLSGKLGYTLRPWLTSIVDYMAKRKSLNSLKGKGH